MRSTSLFTKRSSRSTATMVPGSIGAGEGTVRSRLRRSHPGQKVVTFWLDMWVDAKAPVDRIKVEPQLWVSYAEIGSRIRWRSAFWSRYCRTFRCRS
jgi:hypothetical protein